MLINDQLNKTKKTVKNFKDVVEQSASESRNIQYKIEKIVTKISSVLQNKETKEKSFKYLTENKQKQFFKEFGIQDLIEGKFLIFKISKSMNEIIYI